MAKRAPDPDDVTLYDFDPKFQDRLLKWLTSTGTVIEIATGSGPPSPSGGPVFAVNLEPGGEFETVSLEVFLCEAMGSRSRKRHINPEFQERLHQFLAQYGATASVSAVDTYEGPGFRVTVAEDGGTQGTEADIDLEIAWVLAEDNFLRALPKHRLAPEERAALSEALVPPVQREEEAEERHERLRRALMEPRPELEANARRESYAEQARKYRAYVLVDGVAVSGWEFMDDAFESLDDLPPEQRAAAKVVPKSKLSSGQLNDFAQRNQYRANRQLVNYARWRSEVDRDLRATGMSVADASPEYWRMLYMAGFEPPDAVTEFLKATPAGHWLAPNSQRPPPRPPRAGRVDALRHARRMAHEHDKPFDPEAPREHYARPHHFAVNAEGPFQVIKYYDNEPTLDSEHDDLLAALDRVKFIESCRLQPDRVTIRKIRSGQEVTLGHH